MMADDLEKFIEEQKAKLAQDKNELENDPPYMEMRNKESEKLSESSRVLISMAKENIPPNRQRNGLLGAYGMSLPLGEEYERKKHKLKEERRQDYRRYLSQKNYLTSGEVDPYTRGLSLPIDERRSAKERLRLERNREYNQYLRDKEEWNERLRKLGKKNSQNEADRSKKALAVTGLEPELPAEGQPCNVGAEPPRKDACTSTEGYEELPCQRWLVEDGYRRLDDEVGLRSRLLNKRPVEDLDVPSQRHHGFASRAVISSRKLHRLDEDRDFGRSYYRMDYDPEISEEADPRFQCESTFDRKTPRLVHAERPYLDGTVRDPPADYKDELKERARAQQVPRTRNARNQVQMSSSANEQARSAAAAPYATGLVLGGQDRELLQRKKEKYRQELIAQIAEQQQNKRREKQLELLVAASGARDPEKEPNRLKQFGLTARASEGEVPPERPRAAFQTPLVVPSASPARQDFHRGLASTLGEIAAPRLTPMPPPPPPVVMDSHRTPYDDAYYYFGARNPLDPNLAYNGTGMAGMQPTPSLDPPVGQAPAEQSVGNIGQRNTGDRQRSIGVFSEEKTKPSKEATLSYQQALQQQIREREERRRREREEKALYEAKLAAEMKKYSPWGRGGGGAPLRDAEGNLITDLHKMHKQNEDAYNNPVARLYEEKRAVAPDLSLASPRPENTEASTNKIAGSPFAQTSPFARGNVFGEPLSSQQLKRQESYKNFLRQQIEEKRRREEAEREKLRIEEEKEEKRLAEQRMRIQKAYEDEQEERRRKEEKDPPQPRVAPQPRSPSPPVPARRNQLRAFEDRKNVISELSEMRKQLRSEERRLQEQLLHVASEDDAPVPRGRREKNPRDIFEMARLRLQAPVRRPLSKEARDPVSMQNIWEFNELKRRDSETRVGLRHMYPDPPKDDQTLEIQQQALLREQQRKLDRMRMRREAEAVLDDQGDSASVNSPQTMGLFRNESEEFLKNSLLESDSAFIGVNGETFPDIGEDHLLPQLPRSARERRQRQQAALERAEDVPQGPTPLLQPDSCSSHSLPSLNVGQLKDRNEQRLHRLAELRQGSARSGGNISLGEADDLLLQAPAAAARRPSSSDTAATEPWLRPGTSETLQRLMAEESSPAKLSPEHMLRLSLHSLSTAHG